MNQFQDKWHTEICGSVKVHRSSSRYDRRVAWCDLKGEFEKCKLNFGDFSWLIYDNSIF